MSSICWSWMEGLLDAWNGMTPAVRPVWLQGADRRDAMRAEVDRQQADTRGSASRRGGLMLSGAESSSLDQTVSWSSRQGHHLHHGGASIGSPRGGRSSSSGDFSPRAAIALGSQPTPISRADWAGRERLRSLPMIYILIVAMAAFWKRVILRDADLVLYEIDTFVILALSVIFILLSSPLPISPVGFKLLELGVIGLFAGRLVVIQYRLMLKFSLLNNPMMAQMITKNVVMVHIVLILTYGFYSTKTWRCFLFVMGPISLLPFANLALLSYWHPVTMGWLWRGWRPGEAPWFWLFSFDAMILAILGIGSAFGAHLITRLRHQVAEARQLGQYRLRRQIGSGGMGEVYLAEHRLLKRPCALKLIRPDRLADPRVLVRFEREVRLTATLSHPNTVEIYDYGRTEDGTFYYVMEYLPGLSLAELVDRYGPLPPSRVVYLLRQVCEALYEAHVAGLIHRDIKTSNIFAARRGGRDDVAKLLDFGLVRPTTSVGMAGLSDEGQILGTPLYMSPEQAKGQRELDERSDLYSLGAVAYHLLTGRPPFEDRSGFAVLIALARDPVVPPSLICPGIPADLERVVLRCLAKDAADRYSDAEALEQALAACACAADWDRDSAARWWRDAGRVASEEQG